MKVDPWRSVAGARAATAARARLAARVGGWYVRNDKLVPTLLAIVSVVSAVITMTMGLVGKK